jgi:cytochrome c553
MPPRPICFDAKEACVRKLVAAVSLSAVLLSVPGGFPGSFAVLPASAQTAAVQTLKEQLPTCLACHGENGKSETPEVPSLGAQQAFYVTVQLLMFREKMRTAEPMNDMAKGLTDDDLRVFAEAIAASPAPQPAAGPVDEARMQRARALVQQHRCNFCHRQDFSGQDNVPRIGAQREDYLVKALRGYKDNSRHGYDTAMADVIAPITDADILDLAYYIARAK